jgi:hypothetical protein
MIEIIQRLLNKFCVVCIKSYIEFDFGVHNRLDWYLRGKTEVVRSLWRLAPHIKGNLEYWVRKDRKIGVNKPSCLPWERNAENTGITRSITSRALQPFVLPAETRWIPNHMCLL